MSSLPFDSIVHDDALSGLKKLPSGFVDLFLTSPPYNAGKSYEQKLSEAEYLAFINPIVAEMKRVLKPDGRFAVNVCFNINRREESGKTVTLYPFLAWIDSLRKNGLHIRENIIWNQFTSEADTAWGSWCSASAPYIRHMTENIIIGYNEQWKKLSPGQSDVTGGEFPKWTLDRWDMTAEQDRKIKALHPAPFPEELAKRCIKLFSYVGDVVLDCFVGSGTSCVVAKKFGRRYIGFDSDLKFCKFSERRLSNVPQKLEGFMRKGTLDEITVTGELSNE